MGKRIYLFGCIIWNVRWLCTNWDIPINTILTRIILFVNRNVVNNLSCALCTNDKIKRKYCFVELLTNFLKCCVNINCFFLLLFHRWAIVFMILYKQYHAQHRRVHTVTNFYWQLRAYTVKLTNNSSKVVDYRCICT